MRAQNLYNGAVIVGCRFAFTLPVELPSRGEVAPADPDRLITETATTP
jgi:hypothetical protein